MRLKLNAKESSVTKQLRTLNISSRLTSNVNTSVVQAKLLKNKTNEILIGDEENRNDDGLMEEDQGVDEETESEENMNGAVVSDTMTEEGIK